ncbi:hypothetical protein A3A71_00340 [Candidatus Berkelbacteria bacterium RIFCSPLOWO2_01_FULL_50_28]|uniref:DDH domain-containing protein n=1 Tax=Candidatus Berkelbacteria bacterium RIFCSPLOWO2_01_FULL_50_28 TaxID=1797471 RepID=A0A1F5EB41_9BACT|nr:MAG: hypothetical protein A2807_02260 [Candidatus Berkelbacteria bacterium RIFCSPHIGHO2_01_FULL_50_36]OGD63549.1 MAG: hypothetical protein A3F39_02490 [Candidatus Berkelbacteria bacterium RIFCSPHIGHO2_12_FULL_50_11]OGD64496.1 MAG: hypothetical protein A3A71_00340 [Candidatus Berkelbacteria bacterium RIFCSPLOWO2_01_FULL_50_28]
MELTPKSQSVELIKQANKVLILTHTDPDGDAVGSVLALRIALQKLGKEVEAIFYGRSTDYSNLSGYSEVQQAKLEASNDLVITVDTRNVNDDVKLGYKKNAEARQLNIVITPSKGTLLPEDVVVERSVPKFDLLIILDSPTLAMLGTVGEEFPTLFYDSPTVVIDHHATNSYFGKVNWIDMTAASTTEMLVALIESLSRNEPLIEEEIATCLLTGLISDTGSFQNLNTTPKSLTVAAQLVAAGARHQEIVEKSRSRSLKTLKLWGKALTKITVDQNARFVWTEVTDEDFAAVKGEPGDESGLIDELLKTVTDVDFALTVSQDGSSINGSLRSVAKNYDVSRLARTLGGGGHLAASGFRLEGKIQDKRDGLLKSIADFQNKEQAVRNSALH